MLTKATKFVSIAGLFSSLLWNAGFMSVAFAQENSTTKPTIHNNTRAVIGCLQKSDDEYVLLADDGRTWELTGKTVKLDGQIGHTVIIGGVVSDPVIHVTKVNTKSTMKTNDGYGYMTVSRLTSVSDTCERNS
jgi:hypothetical protein